MLSLGVAWNKCEQASLFSGTNGHNSLGSGETNKFIVFCDPRSCHAGPFGVAGVCSWASVGTRGPRSPPPAPALWRPGTSGGHLSARSRPVSPIGACVLWLHGVFICVRGARGGGWEGLEECPCGLEREREQPLFPFEGQTLGSLLPDAGLRLQGGNLT